MTEELCHIRCIECGKVLANKWNMYQDYLSQGISIKDALTKLGLIRSCCRLRMMNPFKVPIKADRQTDPRNAGLGGNYDQQLERLNINQEPTPTIAPLQAMKTISQTTDQPNA